MNLIEGNAVKFDTYYRFLVDTNEHINLTSIVDKNEVYIKHFLDSLELARAVPDISLKDYSLIDVGTGAGFPGVPLAIAYPNLHVTLTDSLKKRTDFLSELVDRLGINNVSIFHGRAENLGRDDRFREKYDLVTARAVSKLSTLVEYCGPFIHVGGRFIPLKGSDVEDEMKSAQNAVREIGLKYKDIYKYSLQEEMGSRSLLVYEKVSKTPDRYPRKAGTPSKYPL